MGEGSIHQLDELPAHRHRREPLRTKLRAQDFVVANSRLPVRLLLARFACRWNRGRYGSSTSSKGMDLKIALLLFFLLAVVLPGRDVSRPADPQVREVLGPRFAMHASTPQESRPSPQLSRCLLPSSCRVPGRTAIRGRATCRSPHGSYACSPARSRQSLCISVERILTNLLHAYRGPSMVSGMMGRFSTRSRRPFSTIYDDALRGCKCPTVQRDVPAFPSLQCSPNITLSLEKAVISLLRLRPLPQGLRPRCAADGGGKVTTLPVLMYQNAGLLDLTPVLPLVLSCSSPAVADPFLST